MIEFKTEIIDGDIPAGGFKLFNTNYITMNGLFEYNPIHYYLDDKVGYPGFFDHLPFDSPEAISFTMETDFFGVDGSSYKDEETVLVSNGVVNKRMLTGGRYKGFKWSYWQPNPVVSPDQPLIIGGGERTVGSKVLFPVIRKVPYYLATSTLNGVTFLNSSNPVARYFDPTAYNYNMGVAVTGIAMDLVNRMTEKDHFACPIWYEFKFMGYVDGFPDGIATKGDMSRLPDGLTFVPTIDFCSGLPDPDPDVITQGCAIEGGTKFAARMDLVTLHISRESRKLGSVVLHELLHTQGHGHIHGDAENLMTDGDILAAPYLDQQQCELLLKKSHVMGFSGFEPWE